MSLPDTAAARIADIIDPLIGAGKACELRAKIDVATENIYRSLPSGDFSRADVRAEILAILRDVAII